MYIHMALSHLQAYGERYKRPLFSLTPQLEVVRRIVVLLGLAGLPALGACLLFPAFMVVLYLHCACSGGPCLHLTRFTHVCCLTQLTCRLCDTADMSVVSQSWHVCCVTQ